MHELEDINIKQKNLEDKNEKMIVELGDKSEKILILQDLLDTKTNFFNEKILEFNSCKSNYESEIMQLKNRCIEKDSKYHENNILGIENINKKQNYLEEDNIRLAYELERRNEEINNIQNLLNSKTKYFDQQVLEFNIYKNNYEAEIKKLKGTFLENEKVKYESDLDIENIFRIKTILEKDNEKLTKELENKNEQIISIQNLLNTKTK